MYGIDAPETIAANALDPDEVNRTAKGASHIYHCVNPLYHQWAAVLPSIQTNLITAAVENSSVFVASENLYMYKRSVETIDLDTPVDPPTKKGTIRQQLHEQLVIAGENHRLRWATIRGSDYYGPGATDQSVFGTTYFLNPLFSGKALRIMGDPDIPHSYTYLPDFGNALAIAGNDERAYGKPWIVVNKELTSSAELARAFSLSAGISTEVKRLPTTLLRLLGVFNPVIREIPEMLYQKEESYIVRGDHFNDTFGFAPTAIAKGILSTLDWYRTLNEDRRKPTTLASGLTNA